MRIHLLFNLLLEADAGLSCPGNACSDLSRTTLESGCRIAGLLEPACLQLGLLADQCMRLDMLSVMLFINCTCTR